VGPAACCGAVPAGVGPPVGTGAHSMVGPSVGGAVSPGAASSTPPSGAASSPTGVSVLLGMSAGVSTWAGASMTPVSGFGVWLPPLQAPIASANPANPATSHKSDLRMVDQCPRAGAAARSGARAQRPSCCLAKSTSAVLPTATLTEVGTFTTFHCIDQGIFPLAATWVYGPWTSNSRKPAPG